MRNLTFIAVGLIVGWWFFSSPESQGVVLDDGSLQYPGYEFSNQEPFVLEGRVLSRENYRFGREAELSPVDLAMGWDRMTDDEVLEHLRISQSGRWYRWDAKSRELPISPNEITASSSNVHIVPENEMVAQDLARIAKDDRVRLYGHLVDISAPDGWRWRSSRSRTDAGNGACELLLLRRIDWL
jgi:hypothetical protein